jgi:regulator of vacuolar morphogenesis
VPDTPESLKEHSKSSNYESQVFYSDGVCAARCPGSCFEASGEIEEELSTDTQSLYYDLLRRRFLILHSTLGCSPPLSAVTALGASHPISIPLSSSAAYWEWRYLLPTVDPQMAQLACMEMDSVLRLLDLAGRLMPGIVKQRDAIKIRRIGAWVWGLLGRCRDVGQLDSEDVAEIRGLGKIAVEVLTELRESKLKLRESELKLDNIESYEQGESSVFKDAAAGEEVETNDVTEQIGANEHDHQCEHLNPTTNSCNTLEPLPARNDMESQPDPESLEAAKAQLQDRLQPDEEAPPCEIRDEKESLEMGEEAINISRNIHAMLDMVITVVGEFYGQRDLLNARDIWEEDTVDW